MKRILVFIGLKVVEVSGVILVPYWVGRLDVLNAGKENLPLWGAWALGMVYLGIPFFGLFIVVYGLIDLVKINWQWPKRIVGGRK